jgi:two-component system sensor kinase FixL
MSSASSPATSPALIPGTLLSEWGDEYLVTSQSLPAYEGSNWNMLFATFIPQRSVTKMSSKVVDFERNQRVIAAWSSS